MAPNGRWKKGYHDLSHSHTGSTDIGRIFPFMAVETMPGDNFKIGVSSFQRMASLLAPIMHLVDIKFHFFYNRNQNVWPQWDEFITNKSAITAPYFSGLDGIDKRSLAAAFGIPVGMDAGQLVSALPFAHYAQIHDEYYRAQHIQTSTAFTELVAANNNAVGGYSTLIGAPPLKRNWQSDYFTNCLPQPQQGTAVTIPIDGEVDVEYRNGANQVIRDSAGNALLNQTATGTNGSGQFQFNPTIGNVDPNGTQFTDLSNNTGTIEDLRSARILQKYYELLNNAGQRINEWTRAMFGQQTADGRIGRPEYLGGVTGRMKISTQFSTAETLDSSDVVVNPVGSMQGSALSVTNSKLLNFRNPGEFGYIMGICSICPKPMYHQGLHAKWSRLTNYDYATPIFANLGEQAVKTKEIYALGTLTENESVFGYLPRYTDWKTIPSYVTGDFTDNLSFWTLMRDFSTKPELNDTFLTENPTEFDRIFAVSSSVANTIYCHFHNVVKGKRMLPNIVKPLT